LKKLINNPKISNKLKKMIPQTITILGVSLILLLADASC